MLGLAFGYFPPGTEQYALIIAGGTLMTGVLGTASAVVLDVVQLGIRATTIAVDILIGNLLGLAAGPFVTGVMSDNYGLGTSLTILPDFRVLAAIAFALIVPIYQRDLQRANGRSAVQAASVLAA